MIAEFYRLIRTNEELHAGDGFMLVASYNPGYQNIMKTLKPSTRQRFISIEFDFPSKELEIEIVTQESDLKGIKLNLSSHCR